MKVYIVGAGPGDKDLITIKAKRLIDEADIILYDKYMNEEIMNDNKNAEKIYVGKIAGEDYISQDKINELIYKYAKTGKMIVRLKGGDPFVFGRGGEEAKFLTSHGVDVEIVPGISSATSAASFFGIPITHRELARSFSVFTAHSKDHNLDHLNFDAISKIGGTLVFLMARANSTKIAMKLIEHGMDKNTPACFIIDAYGEHARIIRAKLCDIAYDIYKDELISPLIFLVGGVADFNLLQN